MTRRLPVRLMSPVMLLVLLAAASCAPAADDTLDPPAAGPQLELAVLLGGADTLHAHAFEPRPFTFPADHGPHPQFRAEWWYFTGSLMAANGRELGYQLTFFRSALTDSASFAEELDGASAARSAWRSRHAYMAHFAVSDAGAPAFHAAQRFARESLDLAGARAEPFRVWLGDWHAASAGPGSFPLTLSAADGDVAVDLTLDAGKPIVLQGDAGLSRKGAEPGNASYYYSRTRMPTRGTIRIGGTQHVVTGASWLDREWSTSALAGGVEGWDWLSLQLDDGTELMLYRLRRADGTADPYSAGTFVRADGGTVRLKNDDFTMTPVATWSAAGYPVSWHIEVPSLELILDVDAAFPAQELVLAVRYWEGMVRAAGRRSDRALSGRGYLELTGY
ncbi:MAG: lipocalin-like domain-containing protein [Gemmatimonadota bacterium]